MEYSIAPTGERFPLPNSEDVEVENKRLVPWSMSSGNRAARSWWSWGWALSARSWPVWWPIRWMSPDAPDKFVIGMQRPSPARSGRFPTSTGAWRRWMRKTRRWRPMIRRCVKDKKTLIATYTYDVLSPGRCGHGGCAVRLSQGLLRQRAAGSGRHPGPGGVPEDHRREDRAPLPGADRDHRAARHHRVRRLPHRQKGVRDAAACTTGTRCSPTPSNGSCPARITSPRSGISGGSAAASIPRPASGW